MVVPACGRHPVPPFPRCEICSVALNNLHVPWFGHRIAFGIIAESATPDGQNPGGQEYGFRGGVMFAVLVFLQKWNGWYRVLRCGNRFNFVDSVCYGLWLARGKSRPA